MVEGRRLKIRYVTQVKARPPTFAVFVSKPNALPESYCRYLTNTANVVVLVLDAIVGLERQDLNIARHVVEEGRALVVAANKWDLVKDDRAMRALIQGCLAESSLVKLSTPLKESIAGRESCWPKRWHGLAGGGVQSL